MYACVLYLCCMVSCVCGVMCLCGVVCLCLAYYTICKTYKRYYIAQWAPDRNKNDCKSGWGCRVRCRRAVGKEGAHSRFCKNLHIGDHCLCLHTCQGGHTHNHSAFCNNGIHNHSWMDGHQGWMTLHNRGSDTSTNGCVMVMIGGARC